MKPCPYKMNKPLNKKDIKKLIGKSVYLKHIDDLNSEWKVIGKIFEDIRNPSQKYIFFTDETVYPLNELNKSFFLYQYYNKIE